MNEDNRRFQKRISMAWLGWVALVVLMFFFFAQPAHCAGTVNEAFQQLGQTDNYVLSFTWKGDAITGTVPATAARFLLPVQGYRIVSIETAPLTPSPTSGYSVTLTNFLGNDMAAGALAGLSATAAQSFGIGSSVPLIYGTLTLNVTGNSVAGATGKVHVYLTRQFVGINVSGCTSAQVFFGGAAGAVSCDGSLTWDNSTKLFKLGPGTSGSFIKASGTSFFSDSDLGQSAYANHLLITQGETKTRHFGLMSLLYAGASGGTPGDKVAGYLFAQAGSGGRSVWGVNAGATNPTGNAKVGMNGAEIDFNGFDAAQSFTLHDSVSGNIGAFIACCTSNFVAQTGIVVTGVAGAKYREGLHIQISQATDFGIDLDNSITGGALGVTLAARQMNNGGDTVGLRRVTDTAPTGFFLRGSRADSAGNIFSLDTLGTLVTAKYNTSSVCTTAASPAVCAAAPAGLVTIPASATTLTINTTAVTAFSQIQVVRDDSVGAALGITCNTATAISDLRITARTAGTSFALLVTPAPAANAYCLSYQVTN